MDLKEIYVGKLRLDGKVDITDPCYDKDDWCRTTVKCQPGTYTGYAYEVNKEDWGKRIARLSIFKDDKKEDFENMEIIGAIGVDAGLAGFFRDKPDYVSQDEWLNFLVESGVWKTRDEYNHSRNVYDVDFGIFSESGFGDGEYAVYSNKDNSAFTIEFITDDYEDWYEDEDDED